MSELASEEGEIVAVLLNNGWREGEDQFRPYDRFFYKQHESEFRCSGNDHHKGIQVCIYICEFNGSLSIELDMCAELPDGTWLKMLNYCLPANIHAVLSLIPRLVGIWEEANRLTPSPVSHE